MKSIKSGIRLYFLPWHKLDQLALENFLYLLELGAFFQLLLVETFRRIKASRPVQVERVPTKEDLLN
jgi:hypothetical protein